MSTYSKLYTVQENGLDDITVITRLEKEVLSDILGLGYTYDLSYAINEVLEEIDDNLVIIEQEAEVVIVG